MRNDPGGRQASEAMLRDVLEALGNGGSGVPLLRTLLAKVRLTAEQKTVVDMLLNAQSDDDDQGKQSNHGRLGRDGEDPEEPFDNVLDNEGERVSVEQELSDLRQVNDTVAAALGACPFCWGGDSECDVCEGRGSTGSVEPDPALFQELVAPAVERTRTSKRAGRAGAVRRRSRSPSTESGGRL